MIQKPSAAATSISGAATFSLHRSSRKTPPRAASTSRADAGSIFGPASVSKVDAKWNALWTLRRFRFSSVRARVALAVMVRNSIIFVENRAAVYDGLDGYGVMVQDFFIDIAFDHNANE